MAHEFKLSPFGLRLIKAYEGFRALETTLVSGQQVIGYGHRYSLDEEPIITKQKAEKLLKFDLEPYEAMVNDNVFAPLNQSQFDALVSLAFNIGPREFINSRTLAALNNGRPLDAAAGFDEWRKSVIGGKTYVVDALVRRRTAEKSLFLKPDTGVVATPRHELPPQQDSDYPRKTTPEPVFDPDYQAGIVENIPYSASEDTHAAQAGAGQARRRTDSPAGILTLSELDEEGEEDGIENVAVPLDAQDISPIAVAAAQVSERLDKLISDPVRDENGEGTNTAVADGTDDHSAFVPANDGGNIAQSARPESLQATQSKSATIHQPNPEDISEPNDASLSIGGPLAALFVGLGLSGFGVWKWFFGPRTELSSALSFAVPVGMTIGAMIVLGSLYYVLKAWVRR